jgi:hypothetical protein
LELFTRPAEKVLRELIDDLRLAGYQHFAFHVQMPDKPIFFSENSHFFSEP